MIRGPPGTTRTATLFPYTTLFRSPVLRVDARIDSIASHTIAVPPVVVGLLDAAGTSLYEWSVSADAPDLAPGEAVAFSTQLNAPPAAARSEEHTSELQSLMRISYAVFCLKKKNHHTTHKL